MDDLGRDDWRRVARAAYGLLTRGNGGDRGMFDRVWDGTMRRTDDGSRPVRPVVAPTAGADPGTDHPDGEALRAAWVAVAYAHDLVTGARDAIPDAEREAVLRPLDDYRKAFAQAVPAPPRDSTRSGRGGCVRVALACGGDEGPWHLGHVTLDVPPLDPDDAPVACSLVAGDGTWLDVRRAGNSFLRPVLAPGTWRPITFGEFAEAADGTRPWPDSPFERRPDRKERSKVPLAAHLHERRGSSPARSAAADAALARWSAEVGSLVTVDGVVHVGTPEPGLCLVLAHAEGSGTELVATWHMGDLCGRDAQASCALVGGGSHRGLVGRWYRGVDAAASVPVTAAAALADLGATLHGMMAEAPGRNPAPVPFRRCEVVRLVDPDAFARAERPIAGYLRDLARVAFADEFERIRPIQASDAFPRSGREWFGLCQAVDAMEADPSEAKVDALLAAVGVVDAADDGPAERVRGRVLRSLLPTVVREAEASRPRDAHDPGLADLTF